MRFTVGDFITIEPNNGVEGRWAAVMIDEADPRAMFLKAEPVHQLARHTGYARNRGWYVGTGDDRFAYGARHHQPTGEELAIYTRYCLTGHMPGLDDD